MVELSMLAWPMLCLLASTTTELLDPEVLARLDAQGLSFAQVIGAAPDASAPRDLATLAAVRGTEGRAWRDIADVLTDDLARFQQALEGTRDDTHAFFIRALATSSAGAYQIESNGDAPRQLDRRWLKSPHAFLHLVAVVNRLDRRDFDAASPCGEVRLIYRLAYRTADVRSTLPFFVNVVLRAPAEGGCKPFAEAWHDDASAAAWLARTKLPLKQIEVNFQSLRFSAGYMTDFGGQALYLLRIFRRGTDGAFAPAPLENTPDVAALASDPALRDKVLAFLRAPENVAKLDEGTLVVPDIEGRLLARLAISWSTLGRARLGNKPWRDALGAGAFSGVDTAPLRALASTEALLERLDNLSCMGCHQSGGTAGFHMLGQADDRVTDAYNQQQLAFSPHFGAERARRARFIDAVRSGASPERMRPHSFFAAGAAAPIKGACVLADGHFKRAPACGAGLVCTPTVMHASMPVLFGECTVPPTSTAPVGAPCLTGEVEGARASTAASTAPAPAPASPEVRVAPGAPLPLSTTDFRDGFVRTRPLYALPPKFTSTTSSCRPPAIGVPLGRVFRLCTSRERALEDVTADSEAVCAAVGGTKFEECATGDDVLRCLAGAVTRGMVDACSPTRACREDYICQRLPDALPGATAARVEAAQRAGVGFCTPTYFLFQLRADGHPDPITGVAAPLGAGARATEYRGGYRRRAR